MAEIMTDILGAERSGLYATRSIKNPRATVIRRTSGMATPSGSVAERKTMNMPAAIKTSPCAKLIRRRIPYTIV